MASSSLSAGLNQKGSQPSSYTTVPVPTPFPKIRTLQNDILQTIMEFETLHNTLNQTNPVAGSNKQIHTNINRIIVNLDRIESNAHISSGSTDHDPRMNDSSSSSSSATTMIPIDLLEHLADTEMNNPDIWLQSKLQELIDGERMKQVQQIALKAIADKLTADEPVENTTVTK